jgi:hypothetical protein
MKGGVEVHLYSFSNLGTLWCCVIKAMPRPLDYWEKEPATYTVDTGLFAAVKPPWMYDVHLTS